MTRILGVVLISAPMRPTRMTRTTQMTRMTIGLLFFHARAHTHTRTHITLPLFP